MEKAKRVLGALAVLAALAILPTLKLTGVVDWSWWWVTAPLWGVATAVGVLLGFFYLGMKLWQR